jgi:hypothetical protein
MLHASCAFGYQKHHPLFKCGLAARKVCLSHVFRLVSWSSTPVVGRVDTDVIVACCDPLVLHKGMLSVWDEQLPAGKEVVLRQSMVKFASTHKTLEIVG